MYYYFIITHYILFIGIENQNKCILKDYTFLHI